MDRRDFLKSVAAGIGTFAGLQLAAERNAEAVDVMGLSDPQTAIDTISLVGSPEQIGHRWGKLNAKKIREHLQTFVKECRKKNLSEADLLERSKQHNGIIAELAPYWGIEADAIAEAVGIDENIYRAYMFGKYRSVLFDECTSYAAVGNATKDGRTLFHKNRDNELRWQAGYVKRMSFEGKKIQAFVAIGDVSDTGVMMMVNNAGLAGSADKGANDPEWFGQGLTNPYGLRYIAEKASTCAEALEILKWMTEENLYAGGRATTNWLFADATGEAMRVVNYNSRLEHTTVRDGIILNVERRGLREKLEANMGKIDVPLIMSCARLPSVSQKTTISGLTAVIDSENPALLDCGWVSLGRPDETPFLPLYTSITSTPLPLVNGTVYQLSEKGVFKGNDLAESEKILLDQQPQLQTQVLELLKSGQRENARALLTKFCHEAVKHLKVSST